MLTFSLNFVSVFLWIVTESYSVCHNGRRQFWCLLLGQVWMTHSSFHWLFLRSLDVHQARISCISWWCQSKLVKLRLTDEEDQFPSSTFCPSCSDSEKILWNVQKSEFHMSKRLFCWCILNCSTFLETYNQVFQSLLSVIFLFRCGWRGQDRSRWFSLQECNSAWCSRLLSQGESFNVNVDAACPTRFQLQF